MSTLEVDNLSKAYATPGEPLVVLSSLSLQLDAGDSLAIVGPSGSGKSTLLAILGALDRPTSGKVTLDGVDPFALDQRELARFRHDRVGFVFQDHHLLPQLTVLENVLLPFLADGSPTTDDRQRAIELVSEVGLASRITHRPAELSGGERQRVAIARALVRRPRLLLADEPTGNLDAATAQAIADTLLALQESLDSVLVVVTHSSELAAKMALRKRLSQGALVPA